MDGLLIMIGLIVLGLCIDHGLTNIANSNKEAK
jgi:hypothetical protein